MKKLVVLTGAGISAESGLKTFRDAGGLWEGYKVEEVATPEAWHKNPALVQEFYNMRRKQTLEAAPNAAHHFLASLEEKYMVVIVTQNVDNLHERAGSQNIIHLHGMITKAQSSLNPKLVYDLEGWELKMGEKCELGSQLRPHIVWFGEQVPMMEPAMQEVRSANLMLVIGTSLQVYPAAGLINYLKSGSQLVVVDPGDLPLKHYDGVRYIKKTAVEGVDDLKKIL